MDALEFEEQESAAVQSLREKVSDLLTEEQKEDHFLRKWLTAQNNDMEKAEEMLKQHLKFMRSRGLDKIDENYVPPKAAEYFHTRMLGYDSEGSIVRILHLGATDIRGLALSLSNIDALRYATYVLLCDGRRQRKERENDIICHKQVYVFDLAGLNWTSIIQRTVIERAYTMLTNYEKNHPESLKCVYIINAPSFFNFIYNWLKTILPESILSKVHLIPKETASEVLRTHIDLSILPASVGGKLIDASGDPNCPSLYKMPLNAPVPESLMLYNQFGVLDNDPLAVKVTVECGAIHKVEAVVKEQNAFLQWDYQTINYDICFGLSLKKDQNSESRIILPVRRVDSHRIPESGSFTCEETGIYELVFDNSYSWFTKKELVYKVSVEPPEKNPYE